jgi:hypothetical protein
VLQLAVVLLAPLVAPQAAEEGLSSQWRFDGDVRDTGPAALPTKAIGRLDYIDSPVAGAGKMAVFNGVDTFIEVDPAAALGVGATDFALSAWIYSLDRRPAVFFARKGWSLLLLEGGALRLAAETGSLSAPVGSFPANQWNHVVVSVKRAAEGGLSRIVVNGETVGSGDIREGDLDAPKAPLFMGRGLEEGKLFTGFLDEVRLYSRALGAAESSRLTDSGMPWLRPKPHAKLPFAGKFELLQDDVVVFSGGENGRVAQDAAYLETLLALQAAGKRVHFRDMAWEGDTVYEQPRPLNFGSWTDQLRRVGASVVFAQFGQLESLEGRAGVERFTTAYRALLSHFAQTTQRIVLLSPSPFGRGSARQPDLAARNDDLRLYVAAIRKIAEENRYLFVDLTTKPMEAEGLTRDGLHLNLAGHWVAAREIARQLEVPGLSDLDGPDLRGVLRRESIERVRAAIQYKNVLWTDSWRPANWAFLNGDRMEQPSSRDHLDRRVRWFPVEVQQLPAMLRRQEEKIDTLISERK